METMTTTVTELSRGDIADTADFLLSLGDADQTFLAVTPSELASAADHVQRWHLDPNHYIAVARQSGRIVGFAGVRAEPGWSAHVGRLRLVVAAGARGHGIGGRLARQTLQGTLDLGLEKVLVEVRSDQQAVIALFTGLGFCAEALLTDQLRGPDAATYDLLILAHRADQFRSQLVATGLDRMREGDR